MKKRTKKQEFTLRDFFRIILLLLLLPILYALLFLKSGLIIPGVIYNYFWSLSHFYAYDFCIKAGMNKAQRKRYDAMKPKLGEFFGAAIRKGREK